jgi:hypothetical protein
MSPARTTATVVSFAFLTISAAAIVQAWRADLISAKAFPLLGQDAVFWHDGVNLRLSLFSRKPTIVLSTPVPATPSMPEHYEDVLDGSWFRASPTCSRSLWLPLVLSSGATAVCILFKHRTHPRGFPIQPADRKAT